jgi:hypothetical protein
MKIMSNESGWYATAATTRNEGFTMKSPNFIVFIPFIFFIYSCSPSQSAEEEANKITQSTPNITQVAVVEAKRGAFALQLLSNGRVGE